MPSRPAAAVDLVKPTHGSICRHDGMAFPISRAGGHAQSCAARAIIWPRPASTPSDGEPMPWPLAYLIAPLVLHRRTREACHVDYHSPGQLGLPESGHPPGLAARAQSLAEPVREGLRFGLAHSVLQVDELGRVSGNLLAGPRRPTGEVAQILAKAGLVGKWFAKIDQPATAFAILGVAP